MKQKQFFSFTLFLSLLSCSACSNVENASEECRPLTAQEMQKAKVKIAEDMKELARQQSLLKTPEDFEKSLQKSLRENFQKDPNATVIFDDNNVQRIFTQDVQGNIVEKRESRKFHRVDSAGFPVDAGEDAKGENKIY